MILFGNTESSILNFSKLNFFLFRLEMSVNENVLSEYELQRLENIKEMRKEVGVVVFVSYAFYDLSCN